MKHLQYKGNDYIEFETPDEYYKWFQKNYSSEYIKKISTIPKTIEELNSILYYQGHGYLKINNYLRNLKNPHIIKKENNQTHVRIKEIQDFINQNTINNNLVLYRFVGGKEYQYLMKKKNNTKTIKQFLSTTTTYSFCKDERYIQGKLIKILLLKGSHSIALADINKRNPECEILLPYNTQLNFLDYDKNKIPIFQQLYNLTKL